MTAQNRINPVLTMMLTVFAVLSLGVEALAAFITPTGVTPLGTTGWFTASQHPDRMINNSGLSSNSPAGTHNNDANANTMWLAATGAGVGGAAAVVTNQDVVFDLGATYNLAGTHVWNQNQNHPTLPAVGEFYETRGTEDFHIYVSSDSNPLTATWTSVGSKTLNVAGGTATEPAQWVPFSSSNTRLVKFELESALSGNANEYVGLSEVRFQSVNTGEFFSEDFEGTGLADGTFTSGSWGPQFTGGSNLLNPAATGGTAAWLNPVPAELGDIFGTLQAGGTATAELTDAFVDDTTYTLSFTQFKRDDLTGDAVTARIIDANTDSILASDVFPAVTTDDTFLTRTLAYTTSSGPELGHAIRVQFFDANGGNNLIQAGIDNISLAAAAVAANSAVPEPSTAVLATLGLLGLMGFCRRRNQQERPMNTRNRTRTVLTLSAAAMATLVLTTASAHAQLIPINPVTGVTVSTEFPGREGDKIVDGSGLAAGLHNNAAGDMWLTSCCGPPDPNPFVTFDLGAVYSVDSFHVWNYNEGTGGGLSDRGVNDVVVEYGTTLALGSTIAGITNFAVGTDSNGYPGEDFNNTTVGTMPFPIVAQYVKFDINSLHGPVSDSYGLSEVQFSGALAPPVVPEPSTFVLAALGLLGLMGFRRRRNRSTSAVARQHRRRITTVLTLVSAAMVWGSSAPLTASAALIGGVTIEDFSSELGAPFNRFAVESIDGSGLAGGMHDNDAANMWETKGTLQTPNDTAPWHITYDLEANYSLDDIHVWNYNEAAANLFQLGANDVEIYISPINNIAGLVKLDNAGGDFVFAQANGLNTYTGFSVDTSNVTNAALLDNARLVRFNILSAHTNNNGLTGLAEVQFSGGAPITGSAVPEPSTFVLATLCLFGLMGFRRRRRN